MKQKILNIFTAIFSVIFFFAVAEVLISTPASSQSQYLRVKAHPQFNQNFTGIAIVLDGDSIRVGNKEVRLFGIDAPEYSQTCYDEFDREYACGKDSRDFLMSLAGGKKVTCVFAQKDKYDRFLSKCVIGNVSLNEEIIKNGMGVIYDFSESDEAMNKLEAEAKNKKIGIWKGAFQLPKDYRKAHPRN